MSDSLENLRRKIDQARQLGSVVHAMKALATVSIAQYERAARSLDDYVRNVRAGLSVCLRSRSLLPDVSKPPSAVTAVIFGSDQGLVGRFNETIVEHVETQLPPLSELAQLWIVGGRLAATLADRSSGNARVLPAPASVGGISAWVGRLLGEIEHYRSTHADVAVYVLFNHFDGGTSFTPVCERLLPLDAQWQQQLRSEKWPTAVIPEAVGTLEPLLDGLLRAYFFGSLYRACAESLASESASRLVAMQRAERNIGSLVEDLNRSYNGVRQSAIDEELFDLVAGFEALS